MNVDRLKDTFHSAALAALVVAGYVVPAMAASTSPTALAGVRSVTLEVEGVRDDYAPFGMNAAAISSATAASLRQSGIDVVDPQAAPGTAGAALLRIKLNATRTQFHYFSYGLSVSVLRQQPLDTSGTAFFPQTIWTTGRTGIVQPTEMSRLNGYIADLVQEFVRDFRQQNSIGTAGQSFAGTNGQM